MRILIITNTYVGDAILTTGVINHFLKIYPNAKFTISAGFLAAPLFEDCPNLEKLIPIIKQRYSGHWFNLWKLCILTKWDLIIDFKGSPISLFLISKKRIFGKKKMTNMPKIAENARFAKLNFVPPLHLWISESRNHEALSVLKSAENKPIIAIAPTTNWLPKTWPLENFTALIKILMTQEKFSNAVFLIIAAPSEANYCKPLFDALPNDRVIDLTIDLPLLTKVACIKQSILFIGNDSGLMHIASACQTPVIGLFGPTNTTAYYPQGDNAVVIMADYIPGDMPETDQSVMRKIDVALVVDRCQKFILHET